MNGTCGYGEIVFNTSNSHAFRIQRPSKNENINERGRDSKTFFSVKKELHSPKWF